MEEKFKVKYENDLFTLSHSKRGIFKIHRYFNKEESIDTNYFRGYHIQRPINYVTSFVDLRDKLENWSEEFPDSAKEFKLFLYEIKDIGEPHWHDKRYSTESYLSRYLGRTKQFTENFTMKEFLLEYEKIKSMKEEFKVINFYSKKTALKYIRGKFNLRKDILKIVKNKQIDISEKFFKYYYLDKDFLYDLILKFEQFDLWADFNLRGERYYANYEADMTFDNILNVDFYNLVNEYGYDKKNILEQFNNYFGIYENLRWHDYVNLLYDYANMMNLMKVEKFKKFPKFLKSVHDITAKEYMMYKKEYDEKLFKECVDKSLEFKSEEFLVVTPESTKDLYEEGQKLSHCVASYIDRVINKRTQIVFFRYIENEPLVTIEVKGKRIVQAKGFANRPLNKEEKTYLKEYCKKKELIMSV